MAWMLRLLLLLTAILGAAIGCGGPRLPYDPAVASGQSISADPSQPPNDAEWKFLYDACKSVAEAQHVEGYKSTADLMLALIAKKECPSLAGATNRQWFDHLLYLVNTILVVDYNRTMKELDLAPKDPVLLKHKADLLLVSKKWATVYNKAAEPVVDQIEGWILPSSLHPLEE